MADETEKLMPRKSRAQAAKTAAARKTSAKTGKAKKKPATSRAPATFRTKILPKTKAEKLLAKCVLTGEFADASKFADADKEIRSDYLRYLCLNAEALSIDPRGIGLRDARVTGTLDLEGAQVARPVWFWRCEFAKGPILRDTRAKGLAFQSCSLPEFSGDRLSVEGSLSFRDVTVTGETRLSGATVTGQLSCSGATFSASGDGGMALNGDRLSVGGDLFFRDVTVTGETRLLGATVTGQLDCSGATFSASGDGGPAFNGDGLSVGGDLFFRDVTVTGETRLLGATVTGQLDCSGATFSASGDGGMAFSGDRLSVGGDLFFRDAAVTGETRLSGATVTGQLDCSGATFSASGDGGMALNFQSLTAGDSFLFGGLKRPVKGKVDFSHASVGVFVFGGNCWPEEGQLLLDGFSYRAFVGHQRWQTVLKWIKLQPPNEYRPQPYEQAMKVYRETGHYSDAREIGIARIDAYRKDGDLSRAERFWYWISGPLIKYGYKPWRALYAALGLFLISICVFAFAFDAGHIQPSKERVYLNPCYQQENPVGGCDGWVRPARWWVFLDAPIRLPIDYPAFNPITYSLDTVVPIVDLHQESYWLPRDKRPWGGFFRFWHWLHIVLGWVFTTVFIAGLTTIVKKD